MPAAPRTAASIDEEEVDTFLDAVERTIAALMEEIASLRAQLGNAHHAATSGPAAHGVRAEL